ncbi:hypothetical protein FZEAL_2824 [Fusarium zealandicum]|uniref:ATP synthase subunit delta, mitochondrial n=1 Tax=Fusarium zealandicum TaxID=1053134 RepID=A0A8H4XMD2_9HYPO|nr:hypothetical protein FZEAL_2824 [Fusarium zealandicum]
MNSLRFARVALRARPAATRVPLQRRTYAEAVPDKARRPPAPAIYKSQDVVQVNMPAESGEMGVLANHVPSIEQLKPGLVEVIEESAGAKQYFLSGGFATVQPNSVLSINAVEGFPLEDFSADAIRAQITEAQKVANGSGSEQDIAEAKIELEVLETLAAHAVAGYHSFDQMARSYAASPSRLPSWKSRQTTQTQEAVWIPSGIVGDRIRQLKSLANSGFGKPASRNTLIGEDTPSLALEKTYFDIKPQRSYQRPSAPGTFQDGKHISEYNLRQLRSSVSEADLRSQSRTLLREKVIDQNRRHSRHAASEEIFPSESLDIARDSSSPLPSTHGSVTVSSTERRQDAMEIFDQYGISRPEGWLSEDDSDVTKTARETKTKVFRVCHSCGAPLSSLRYCSHCGHDSCLKCTGEASEERPDKGHNHSTERQREHQQHRNAKDSPKKLDHTAKELKRGHVHTKQVTVRTTRLQEASRFTASQETPRTPHWVERTSRRRFRTTQNVPKPAQKKTIAAPTAISTSVKNNPFFVADREAKAHVSEPTTTTRTVQAKRPTRLSECVPGRSTQASSTTSMSDAKCSDPGCRATHAGHHPVRHSIECAARRSLKEQPDEDEGLEVIDMDEEQPPQTRGSPLRGALEKKIDQLYHHAEDLHHSQHIMEHLAAGARNLERSAAAKRRRAGRKDARSRMRDTSPNPPSSSTRDHSLSHDEITAVGEDVVEHKLSIDAQVPDSMQLEPHKLAADHTVDRELSPKSHQLLDDVRTRAALLVKSNSINQDRAVEAQQKPAGPLRRSFPLVAKTVGINPESAIKLQQPMLAPLRRVETKIVSETGKPASPFEGHSHATSKQQSVHAIQDWAVEKPLLHKVPQNAQDHERETAEATNVSSWRKQLRKVDKSEDQPREKKLTPPIVKWRRSLSKVHRTPQPDIDKKDSCLFCFPSRSPSPEPADGTPQLIIEDQPTETIEHGEDTAVDLSTHRLRLMDVEQSLARKSAEDFMEESLSRTQQQAIKTQEIKSITHCRTTSHSSYEETKTVTEIHNPKPLIPYNHVCAWRTRYMDLNAEIEQIKSETSPRSVVDETAEHHQVEGVDAGVGTSLSHQCPDIDIEGLTIVMHMRGKDDLVINTKLKEELRRGQSEVLETN